jgi:hypothetical protein
MGDMVDMVLGPIEETGISLREAPAEDADHVRAFATR